MDFHKRAQEIFRRASEMSADRTDAFAVEECGSNQELLAQVRKLLGVHDIETSDPRPLRESPQSPPKPRIPNYELIRKIGGGGLGTVWLARNDLGEDYCA